MDEKRYNKSLAALIGEDDDDRHLPPEASIETIKGRVSNGQHSVSKNDSQYGDDDDDNDESFFYTGIDRRKELLGHDADEDGAKGAGSDADSYDAKMREILGSDDEDDNQQSQDQYASTSTPPEAIKQESEHDDDDEEEFVYPQSVPQDMSYDTRLQSPDLSARARLSGPPPMHSTPRSVSASSSTANRLSSVSALPTPQRPSAYPSISRLRSSFGPSAASFALPRHSSLTLPTSTSSSSSLRHQRSPIPFELLFPGGAPVGQTPPSESSAPRSRTSSISFSIGTGSVRKRRKGRTSFPYGPTPGPSSERVGLASARKDPETSTLRSDEIASNFGGREPPSSSGDALVGSQFAPLKELVGSDDGEWRRDFVRWSALRKVSSLVYRPLPGSRYAGQNGPSKGKRARLEATVLAVAGGLVAVGTRGGKAIVFEYSQDIKCICGSDDMATPAGAVTALAFSSDHTFLGVGHASGHIYLYDLSRPTRAARHVPPVPLDAVKAGKKEGHLRGSKIVHLGFVGLRHTAIVSGDNKGLGFYHALGKILGVSSNDTLRLLGRYPQYEHEEELGLAASKRSTIFGLTPLPLGPSPHLADQHHFIALLTPSKMVLVGLKPAARTWYRKVRPKKGNSTSASDPGKASQPSGPSTPGDGYPLAQTEIPSTSPSPSLLGCLAWFPASTEQDGSQTRQTNPVLAFAFGNRLHMIRLVARAVERHPSASEHSDAKLVAPNEEVEVIELTGREGIEEKDDILAMQWFSPDLLMLVSKIGLALFDCRVGRVTERMVHGGAETVASRLVEHGWYNSVLGLESDHEDDEEEPDQQQEEQHDDREDLTPGTRVNGRGTGPRQSTQQPRSWAISHSVRVSKGKAFFLTDSELVVGTLLSWADRLLAYVSEGDVLSAIDLATVFFQDNALGSAVGLPSSATERKELIGRKLRELMTGSTEYAFSPDRLTDSTHITPDGRGVDRTPLFEGLARSCARACLALGDLDYMFNVLYDKYEENGIEGIFVGQMEQFIVSGELRTLPIPVVQRLVEFRKRQEEYDLAEQIIWHVDPKSLDLDQALSLCIDQRLFDAMIYVYNAALEDYVAPIIELLVPLKRILRVRRRVQAKLLCSRTRVGQDESSKAASEVGDLDNTFDTDEGDEQDFEDAYKTFSYLSVILTGHQYPSQEPIAEEERANAAKTSVYSFVFSGRCMIWPPGKGGRLVLSDLLSDSTAQIRGDAEAQDEETMADAESSEPIYPYLRLFLELDAEAFLDALDVAFEDPFLDDEDLIGKRISRQLIVDILLELSKPTRSGSMSFDARARDSLAVQQDELEMDRSDETFTLDLLSRTFINIFIARNAPKYPQFIRLSSADVSFLLHSLSIPNPETFPDMSLDEELLALAATREDRQLATEYLLSTYRPSYDEQRLCEFELAGFDRILQSAFRQDERWDRLLAMFLRDFDSDRRTGVDLLRAGPETFSHIEECLVKAARSKQRAQMLPQLHKLLVGAIDGLLDLGALKTVKLLDRFFPDDHAEVIKALQGVDELKLLLFLRCFFEPLLVEADARQIKGGQEQQGEGQGDLDDHHPMFASAEHLDEASRELFISLLSYHDPDGIVRNLDARGPMFFDLEIVIAICEQRQTEAEAKPGDKAVNGDAILWCLDRLGRPAEAFDQLDGILGNAAVTLGTLLRDRQKAEADQQARDSSKGLSWEEDEDKLLDGVRKTVQMAVRLCIERANRFQSHDSDDEDSLYGSPAKGHGRGRTMAVPMMDTDEVWLRLLRSLVRLVHDLACHSSTLHAAKADTSSTALEKTREIVQDTLSALVSSTAAEAVSFPTLFKRLIGEEREGKKGTSSAQPLAKYYAEVRAVLEGMLDAYRLRSDLLGITNKLFDRDTFNQFRRLNIERKRGWRPASGQSRCGKCGLIVVGSKRGTMGGGSVEEPSSRSLGTGTGTGSGGRQQQQQDEADSAAGSRRASTADENLRRRVLRNGSVSLSVPATPLHRRPRSPYDDKAAPLSSPTLHKGKAVVRDSDTSGGGDDGIDDYFSAGPSTSVEMSEGGGYMLRSSSSGSLRINEGTGSRGEDEEQDSDQEGEAGEMAGGEDKANEPIFVLRNGQVYHQSCFDL